MNINDLVAALMFVGVVAYAVLGGADFGTGMWDLLAGDAEQGAELRRQIDHSIGPVWEANHVWLVYILVFLWTGFPVAFGALITTLYVPFLLVALGVVLRGGAFAFRKFSATHAQARTNGIMFATSSVVTPFFLGMIAGAVASGRVTAPGGHASWSAWTGPLSWVGGILAVLTVSFLAAVFLTADAAREGHHTLARMMARRSLIAGAVTGAVALLAGLVVRSDAPTLFQGLSGKGSVIVVASAVFGLATLALLRQGRYQIARFTAVGAVALIVIGWGIAQYPFILVDDLTIDEAAGAHTTMVGLIIVFAVAAVTAVPALIWLYMLVSGAVGPDGKLIRRSAD